MPAAVSDTVAAAGIAGASGVLGALLGAVTGAGLEVLRGRQAREARRDDQRTARRAFERETLLKVQEVLAELADEVAHLAVLVLAGKDNSDYRAHSAALMSGTTQAQMLKARIQDDELRRREQDFRLAALAVTEATTREAADAAFERASDAYQAFNDRWQVVFAALLEAI